MRATIAALILCLLVAALAGAGAAAGSVASVGDESAPAGPPAVAEPAQPSDGSTVAEPLAVQADGDAPANATFNGTSPETIDVQVHPDGDARFEVAKEFPASAAAEQASFERVADEFRDEERDLGLAFFEDTVDEVSDETDRSMDVDDVERDASTADGVGRLTLSFTWRNFANVSDNRVQVEDGFHVEDGVWLRSLGPGQELTIHAPDGFSVAHSESLVRDRAVVWEGPTTFERGDFQTVFDRSGDSGGAWVLVGIVGVVLVVAGSVGLLAYRRRSGTADAGSADPVDEPGPTASGDGGETADGVTADQAAAAAGAASANPEPETDESDVAASAASAGAATEESEQTDAELLSDEERVEQLLERNGGRMKQARIVDETDWSNAKVSQLLSEMAEEDRVDKLRLGRENLISLPDEDVTATE